MNLSLYQWNRGGKNAAGEWDGGDSYVAESRVALSSTADSKVISGIVNSLDANSQRLQPLVKSGVESVLPLRLFSELSQLCEQLTFFTCDFCPVGRETVSQSSGIKPGQWICHSETRSVQHDPFAQSLHAQRA